MMWGKLKHGQSSNQRIVHSECCTQKSKIGGCYCSAATHSPIVHCVWAVVATNPLTFLHKIWHWQILWRNGDHWYDLVSYITCGGLCSNSTVNCRFSLAQTNDFYEYCDKLHTYYWRPPSGRMQYLESVAQCMTCIMTFIGVNIQQLFVNAGWYTFKLSYLTLFSYALQAHVTGRQSFYVQFCVPQVPKAYGMHVEICTID
jgi:hypothetical protein